MRLAQEGDELRPAGGNLTMPGHPHGALDPVFDGSQTSQISMHLEGDPQFEVIDFDA